MCKSLAVCITEDQKLTAINPYSGQSGRPVPELAKYFQPDTGPYLVFGLLGLTQITQIKRKRMYGNEKIVQKCTKT